jgi:phage-related protein
MSSRSYDFILNLADSTGFAAGNTIYGANSNTYAEVIEVQGSNKVKVKLNNVTQEFEVGETVFSNVSSIETFYEQYVFTSSAISVRGNNYGIDGSTTTFPLYRKADFKDEILVYADNELVHPDQYEFPSRDLDKMGIDFNLKPTVTFNVGVDTTTSSDRIYPDTSIANLTVAVSRGIYTNESFIASNTPNVQLQLGSTTVSSIDPSNYVVVKNAFEQEPLVRLFSIYYPGEWYPPNTNGNPAGEGAGYPWPYQFPLRYAEIIGEDFSIPDYSIQYDSKEYKAFPISYPGISISSDGSIGEVTLSVSTLDDTFTSLIEASQTVGYGSNGVNAYVNGESLTNIDPRTVSSHPLYDIAVVGNRGGANLALDYASAIELNGTWTKLKQDSRDLTGAIVEIKTTFASMLDVWPEFSLIDGISSNVITVKSTGPYRVGDVIRSNSSSITSNIVTMDFNTNTLQVDSATLPGASVGEKLYIENAQADSKAFVDQIFVITRLNSLNESSAEFTAANWTQKLFDDLPRRKFYRNTCPWQYKGAECQYPSSGSGVISNTTPSSTANGYFTINNVTTTTASLDKCSKSVTACALRNNLQHFGGFPGVQDDL